MTDPLSHTIASTLGSATCLFHDSHLFSDNHLDPWLSLSRTSAQYLTLIPWLYFSRKSAQYPTLIPWYHGSAFLENQLNTRLGVMIPWLYFCRNFAHYQNLILRWQLDKLGMKPRTRLMSLVTNPTLIPCWQLDKLGMKARTRLILLVNRSFVISRHIKSWILQSPSHILA